MKKTEMQMRSSDKHLEQATEIVPDDSDDVDGEDAPCAESVTLEKERHRFETEDKPFWDTYNFLLQELSNVMSKNSEEDYICFVNNWDIRKSAICCERPSEMTICYTNAATE